MSHQSTNRSNGKSFRFRDTSIIFAVPNGDTISHTRRTSGTGYAVKGDNGNVESEIVICYDIREGVCIDPKNTSKPVYDRKGNRVTERVPIGRRCNIRYDSWKERFEIIDIQ